VTPLEPDYTYHGFVGEVVDGNTVVVDILLGFDVSLWGVKCRLYGVSAPEGVDSQRALEGMIRDYSVKTNDGKFMFLVKTRKVKGNDGWFIELIGCDDKRTHRVHINEEMVRRKHAVTYFPD
jgi:hypothetical protein